MKKFAVAAAALAAAAVFAGGVSANPDAGRVIASGFGCTILDGNGAAFTTFNSSITVYQTKAVLRCSGDGAGARPFGPIYWNYANTGSSCNFGFDDLPATTDWSDKVGYNGNSQLVCTDQLNGAAASGAPSGTAGVG